MSDVCAGSSRGRAKLWVGFLLLLALAVAGCEDKRQATGEVVLPVLEEALASLKEIERLRTEYDVETAKLSDPFQLNLLKRELEFIINDWNMPNPPPPRRITQHVNSLNSVLIELRRDIKTMENAVETAERNGDEPEATILLLLPPYKQATEDVRSVISTEAPLQNG